MNKTAAVTGAASGIGRAFCRRLGCEGLNLILIDRSRLATIDFAQELHAEFPSIQVKPCVADLTKPSEVEKVEIQLKECQNLEMLVNCAGFGTCGNFFDVDLAGQLDMIHLHVVAAVRFCHAVLTGMIARNSGAIINVASVAAFTRFPDNATYSATKMFLVAFTECLEAELKKVRAFGVRVQALCPGQTRTAFSETEPMKKWDPSRVPSFMWMTPEQLVDLSLTALARRSGTFIPLLKNRIFVFIFGNRFVLVILSFLRGMGILEKVLAGFKKFAGKSNRESSKAERL